jgi:hypothetical protein
MNDFPTALTLLTIFHFPARDLRFGDANSINNARRAINTARTKSLAQQYK